MCLQRVAKLAVVEPPVAVLVKLQELGPHVGRAGGPLPLAQLTDHRVELVEIEQPVAVCVVPLQQVRRMRGRAVEGQRLERIPQLAVVKPAAAVVVVPHKGVTNIGGNPMGHRVRQSMRSLASRAQRSNGNYACKIRGSLQTDRGGHFAPSGRNRSCCEPAIPSGGNKTPPWQIWQRTEIFRRPNHQGRRHEHTAVAVRAAAAQ